MFMPKSACRIFLEITDVRVERVNEISDKDAIAEGIDNEFDTWLDYRQKEKSGSYYFSPKESFKSLWQSINGEQSWNENPWVWCISFNKIERPSNFLLYQK